MPYCTQCGTYVLDTDQFCPHCGQAQRQAAGREAARAVPPHPSATSPPPATPPPPAGAAPAAGLRPNIAAMLCYLPGLGWIAAVIFLTLDAYRRQRYVRFHAFQGLYLAVLWLLVQVFFFPFPTGHWHPFPFPWGLRGLIKLFVIIAQVVGIIKTLQNRDYRLPVLGELAEKSLS